MLGGDFAVRKREALSLIEKEVADNLLIPAWRQVIRYDDDKPEADGKKDGGGGRPAPGQH